MRDFGISFSLIILAVVVAVVLKDVLMVENKAWVFLPIGIVLLSGAYQIRCFIREKKKLDAAWREFRKGLGPKQ